MAGVLMESLRLTVRTPEGEKDVEELVTADALLKMRDWHARLVRLMTHLEGDKKGADFVELIADEMQSVIYHLTRVRSVNRGGY